MQSTNPYLELLHERGKRGLPLERVYRQLYNTNLYLTAYGKIYRNNGAMTPGVTEETADSMSLEKIETIMDALRHERYQWNPARRVCILKRNGKKRPLGVTTWSDKLLAEVIRMMVSPVLSNVLLNKLDTFVETVLIPQHTKGDKRRANKAYGRLLDRAKGLFKQGQKEAAQRVRRQAQRLPSHDATDANYRRLRYCRYADDFVLGFTGPKSEAEQIKQQRRHVLARRTQARTL